jgi:dihydropteroate synthase
VPQDTFFSRKMTLNLRGNLVNLDSPMVMGILNLTPDSFYSSSRVFDEKNLLDRVTDMVCHGVDIIDIGGYSSRPNAEDISIEIERNRVSPAIASIKKEFPEIIISIDTFRSEVAKNAVEVGADMINDISGGSLDTKMFDLVADLNVPYILMHMKGSPQTMKELSNYDNMSLEILDYFQKKVHLLRSKGIKDVIIDPGFGFAKNIDQNYEILRNLRDFDMLELPMLVGLSRKSMIYKKLKIEPEAALNGTTALNMIALQNGAKILRVHDVKEAVETVKLFNLTYMN